MNASHAFVRGGNRTPSGKTPNTINRLEFKTKLQIGFGILFMTSITALVLLVKLPDFVFYLYTTLSVVCIAFYKTDKYAAQHGHWRTTERFLQVLPLFGGWPGALVIQQLIKHKTKNMAFRIKHFVMVITNLVAFSYIFTE